MSFVAGMAVGALIIWVSMFVGYVLGASDEFDEEEDTDEYERTGSSGFA